MRFALDLDVEQLLLVLIRLALFSSLAYHCVGGLLRFELSKDKVRQKVLEKIAERKLVVTIRVQPPDNRQYVLLPN